MDSRDPLACYPQGNFYPLIGGLSTQHHRVTKPVFPLCSRCPSRSQAPLCLCTLQRVSIPPEGTFGRLRYLLGGDRPSQTAYLTLSMCRLHGSMLEFQHVQGGISPSAPVPPKGYLLSLPPILRSTCQNPISGYSKAPWGLPVLPRVEGIFTPIVISPSPSLRQRPSRHTFHAGRNLPDKEFRYLGPLLLRPAFTGASARSFAHSWANPSP